ncbi:MAG: SpoIIE family protein phosphatase [Actinomycetia bacterium]|nr:SpoIIE family protein phosphatase [Actinomycetes bacterium]
MKETANLKIINEVAISVAQSIELKTVLLVALDKVMEAFNVTSGGIYLQDLKTNLLILEVHHGLSPAFIAEKSTVAPGGGCAGWAIDHNELFSAHGRPETGFICEDSDRLMGIDCLVASPIATKRRVHGVIELFAPVSRRLSEDEAHLIKVISNQIGMAVDNARLYEESRENVAQLTELQLELAATNKRLKSHLSQESHIAEILQKSLLPRKIPKMPGIAIAARLISATQAADVGGDFYDFMELRKDKFAIILGDVCGSGIDVATLTGMAKNTIRAFAWEDQDVAQILNKANRVICAQTDPSKFVALFFGIIDLDRQKLDYCVAGQPKPFLARSGQIEQLNGKSMLALGVDENSDYQSSSLDLQKDDTLLAFTDGLIEARKGSELFSETRILEIMEKKLSSSLDVLVDSVITAARDFGGGTLRDDVAIISLRVLGE